MKRDYLTYQFCYYHTSRFENELWEQFREKKCNFEIPHTGQTCDFLYCPICGEEVGVPDFDEEEYMFMDGGCECVQLGRATPSGLRKDKCGYYKLGRWASCGEKPDFAIYPGYFDEGYKKTFQIFIGFCDYYKVNKNCNCYWPELSLQARTVNNEAYVLFDDLLSTTALGVLVTDIETQINFVGGTGDLNKHGVVVSFVCHSFMFSDYARVCRDLEAYSHGHYTESEILLIKSKIQKILNALGHSFHNIYSSCLSIHKNYKIENELCFLKKYLSENQDQLTE